LKNGFKKDAPIEVGIYTLGDHMPNPHTGERIPAKQRINEIIQLAVAAEEAGLDFIGIGESHQDYFTTQAHTVILGAIAQATDKIKIGSSSTIISTLDPVRVYEDFATIDAISDERVEIVAGRASRVGVFDMLGYHMEDYEELYDEKLDLLKLINENEIVNWEGEFRASLKDAKVLPRAEREIPLWRAVGGAPPSAIAAGRDNIPMNLASLAGPVDSFEMTVNYYREAASRFGHNPEELPITLSGLFFTADSTKEAIQEAYPYINNGFTLANGSGMPKRAFAQAQSMDSVLNVGDPDFLIEKILHQHEKLGFQRYLGELDLGGVPFEKQLEMIDVIGNKIAPALRKHTGK
jgi:alkanesulfonate monooxygenase SsuD/methylene tetrahydromethanopterin reductase-like flavin-dependent oxidoreductase (luciferase family)